MESRQRSNYMSARKNLATIVGREEGEKGLSLELVSLSHLSADIVLQA